MKLNHRETNAMKDLFDEGLLLPFDEYNHFVIGMPNEVFSQYKEYIVRSYLLHFRKVVVVNFLGGFKDMILSRISGDTERHVHGYENVIKAFWDEIHDASTYGDKSTAFIVDMDKTSADTYITTCINDIFRVIKECNNLHCLVFINGDDNNSGIFGRYSSVIRRYNYYWYPVSCYLPDKVMEGFLAYLSTLKSDSELRFDDFLNYLNVVTDEQLVNRKAVPSYLKECIECRGQ